MKAIVINMIDYYFSDSIRRMDENAIEKANNRLTFITRAGRGVADTVYNSFHPNSALIFCGKGNNGMDGLLCAIRLAELGTECSIVTVGADHCRYLSIMSDYGITIPLININSLTALPDCSVIVDAILGMGQARNIEGEILKAAQLINSSGLPIISIDCPTGISSDWGKVLGCGVKADLVCTMSVHKPGLDVYPGKEYCKEVKVLDVGIPTGNHHPTGHALEEVCLSNKREVRSNKGSFGRTVCFVGSASMCGAAYFCAMSAYLCGTGIVEIVTHRDNRAILSSLVPEAIITCYNDENNIEELTLNSLSRATSVVAGCGMGMDSLAVRITQTVLSHCNCPQVYDADAINIMAKYNLMPKNPRLAVFTPHLKEFERISGVKPEDAASDPLTSCREFAAKYSVTCLLKDARTVISSPDGLYYINRTGNCGMATAGSGDVLAGILGGLLSFDSFDICKTTANAAFIHGSAGDLAACDKGIYSMTARDIMNNIPQILKKIK